MKSVREAPTCVYEQHVQRNHAPSLHLSISSFYTATIKRNCNRRCSLFRLFNKRYHILQKFVWALKILLRPRGWRTQRVDGKVWREMKILNFIALDSRAQVSSALIMGLQKFFQLPTTDCLSRGSVFLAMGGVYSTDYECLSQGSNKSLASFFSGQLN